MGQRGAGDDLDRMTRLAEVSAQSASRDATEKTTNRGRARSALRLPRRERALRR